LLKRKKGGRRADPSYLHEGGGEGSGREKGKTAKERKGKGKEGFCSELLYEGGEGRKRGEECPFSLTNERRRGGNEKKEKKRRDLLSRGEKGE